MGNSQQYFNVYRTYLEVDLDAIAHNGAVAREQFPQQKILTVLKANAYGHGITGILPACEGFSDMSAVATAEEPLKFARSAKGLR